MFREGFEETDVQFKEFEKRLKERRKTLEKLSETSSAPQLPESISFSRKELLDV